MSEVWKDIPGYEGLYQVSDLGRVRSLDRWVTYKNGKQYFYEGGLRKPTRGTRGRLVIKLSKDNKGKTFYIHSLVAMTFIGDKPEGYVVAHKDGDPDNNRLDNIRFDTQSQNIIDVYRQGKKHGEGKLSLDNVLEIRMLYKTGEYTQMGLGKMFGVSHTTIRKIVIREKFSFLNDNGTIQESNTAVS
ncbi:NUMOD4 motif-containing HNH endonuclease [Staphylococcus cohnii]|uniref:NUMOD4 motif-containing HNH endonuclease n=1 Tax=Staphylococcus cohnii TaxID=29382 RepID=UPI003D7CA4CB